jgi:hypothetical protein
LGWNARSWTGNSFIPHSPRVVDTHLTSLNSQWSFYIDLDELSSSALWPCSYEVLDPPFGSLYASDPHNLSPHIQTFAMSLVPFYIPNSSPLLSYSPCVDCGPQDWQSAYTPRPGGFDQTFHQITGQGNTISFNLTCKFTHPRPCPWYQIGEKELTFF